MKQSRPPHDDVSTAPASAPLRQSAHLRSLLMGARQVDQPASAQTTIGPHSPVYYAVGGGSCCREDPENRLVPGPTSSYDSSGVTRNEQVRSSILLSGSKKRCNCRDFERSDAYPELGGPLTGHKLVHFRTPAAVDGSQRELRPTYRPASCCGRCPLHLATDSGFSVSRFAPCRRPQNLNSPVGLHVESRGLATTGGGWQLQVELMADLDIASECRPRAARASGYRVRAGPHRCPLCSGNPCCSGSPLVRHR